MKEADTAGIKVTKQMVDEGVRVLADSGMLWLEDRGTVSLVVREVYLAMIEVQQYPTKTGTQRQTVP